MLELVGKGRHPDIGCVAGRKGCDGDAGGEQLSAGLVVRGHSEGGEPHKLFLERGLPGLLGKGASAGGDEDWRCW